LQLIYNHSREAFHDKQTTDELEFERQKFSHQKAMEELRQEHEQRRWREDFTIQMTLKLVDVRLTEYAPIWAHVSKVAKSVVLTPALTQELAGQIRDWRYAKGGLLADEATRQAAVDFQEALWEFDGTPNSEKRLRDFRARFRDALRADVGMGENALRLRLIDEINTAQHGSGARDCPPRGKSHVVNHSPKVFYRP
jgi:hypothetical protein